MANLPSPPAAIVAVGDELLFGETVDTNSAWLARELTRIGLPVVRRYSVRDVTGDIQEAVAAAAAKAELVVVTGGLGPTRDDLTRDAVAELYGRALREDPGLIATLESRFAERGFARLPEPNRTQAMVPEGARILRNRHGTAPGLAFEAEDVLIALLPGVPREMRGICEEELFPWLLKRYPGRLRGIRHRLLHTTGIAESRLAELVEEALPDDMGPVTIAFLPDALGVDLRLTVQGMPTEAATAALDAIEGALATVIEPWRFDSDLGDIAETVTRAVRSRGATLAVAESCTGGMLAQRITRVAGVSDIFLGGVVTYANEAKQALLGIPSNVIERHGAVSEEVARGMAQGVVRLFGAGVGVGITGIAGPGGGSAAKPVGTLWTAVALEGRTVSHRRLFLGDREGVQARAAQDALKLLLDQLRDPEANP